MATEYGARLRAARKHAGLTQQELSKKAGIPQSTISTAERMGSGSAETITYAQVCGVDANWLAKGEGEMLPRQLESGSSVGGDLSTGPIGMSATPWKLPLGQMLEQIDNATKSVAPILQAPCRAALMKWAIGEATIAETTATIDAFIKASEGLPPLPAGLSETPVKVQKHET